MFQYGKRLEYWRGLVPPHVAIQQVAYEREMFVLRARRSGLKFREIGALLGRASNERARQIEAKAIRRERAVLRYGKTPVQRYLSQNPLLIRHPKNHKRAAEKLLTNITSAILTPKGSGPAPVTLSLIEPDFDKTFCYALRCGADILTDREHALPPDILRSVVHWNNVGPKLLKALKEATGLVPLGPKRGLDFVNRAITLIAEAEAEGKD